MRLSKAFTKFGNKLLDLVYPSVNRCLYCGQSYYTSEMEGMCSDCLKKIEFIKSYCTVCGRALENENQKICLKCSSVSPFFNKARSIGCYQGLFRRLILEFKYFKRLDLKSIFAKLLAIHYRHYYGEKNIKYIIPVPLHENRLEERGFNQTVLLGYELEKLIKTPLVTDVLKRIKNTPPLYSYAEKEREVFMKNSFAAAYNADSVLNTGFNDSAVLLIDDIFTTGSTVNEASFVLKNAVGVNSVYVLTLATAKIKL